MPKIDKRTSITLLDNKGKIRIETFYSIEAGAKTFITSEAIETPNDFTNIAIEIDGKAIPEEKYNRTLAFKVYKFIEVKEALNFLKKGEVYIKYETILPLNKDMTKVPLLEITQHSAPQTEVSYFLRVCTIDKDYRPSIFGRNKTFIVKQYKEDYITLERQYKSVSLEEKNKATLIPSLFFFDIASHPLVESSRTFRILNPTSVIESYCYRTRNVKGENEKKLVYYPLEDYIEIISSPKIIIKIDEREFSPILVESNEIKDIVEERKDLKTPSYYIGEGLNSNKNTIFIAFPFSGNLAEVNIEVEYRANNIVTTDGFNYIFESVLAAPGNLSKLKDYVTVEIPEEFSFYKTNYLSNLKNKDFKHSKTLEFLLESLEDYKSEPLRIQFYRNETELFNFFKMVNIIMAFIGVNLLLCYIFGLISFKNNLITNILKIGVTLLPLFISSLLGKFSIAGFFEAFRYTYAFVPLVACLFFVLLTLLRK